MFFKISGAFFVVFGCALAGAYKAHALSERVLVLESFSEAIAAFRNEISFITADMETALGIAAERDKSGIFGESLKSLFEKGAYVSFKDAVSVSGIKSAEKEVLLSFAKGLSGQDKESQISNADIAIKRIEHITGKAAEEKEKLSPLYFSVYLLCGMAGSILLL